MDSARLVPINAGSRSSSPHRLGGDGYGSTSQTDAHSYGPHLTVDSNRHRSYSDSADRSRGLFYVGEGQREAASEADGDDDEAMSFLRANESMVKERLRRHLKFFFMNPWEKWLARRKFPWKLFLQLIKLIVVTAQLGFFGSSRSSHVDFIDKSTTSFKHLYLQYWEPGYETMPYPPSTGTYAIYTIPDFYEHVNYAARQHNQTAELAIGAYDYDLDSSTQNSSIRMCNTHYAEGIMYPSNQTYYYNSDEVTDCYSILPLDGEYNIEAYLDSINATMNFDRVKMVHLYFNLTTIHLKELSMVHTPDCFLMKTKIIYDNSGHNGQLLVDLETDEQLLTCNGQIASSDEDKGVKIALIVFDVFVIIISVLSLILCARSLYRARRLRKETVLFFSVVLKKKLSRADRLEFLDLWYVMIIVNDVLTIVGSILKIRIENNHIQNYEFCGVMLGTGNLLVWFGVLRYLGMLKRYNILILTLKRAVPNVLRFLVCAGVFYLGFTFCGWVILGPYHIKFRTLSASSECLFSLINGDDMFVTFQAIDTKTNFYIWWYSRIYLYTFISLFIYIVLSVFISVIMDTYETVKHFYREGFPRSALHAFISECRDHPSSPLYRSDESCAHSLSQQIRQHVNRSTPRDEHALAAAVSVAGTSATERTPLVT